MRSLLPKSIFVLVQPTSLKQANLESMKRMYLVFGILLEEGFRFGALLESSLFQFILDMKQLKSSWKGDTQLTLTFCEKKAFQKIFLFFLVLSDSSELPFRATHQELLFRIAKLFANSHLTSSNLTWRAMGRE